MQATSLKADSANMRPVESNCSEKVVSRTEEDQIESRYYKESIYGDADEATVALERLSTRATVASRAGQSSIYRMTSRIDTDGLDEIPAGEEFTEDDPELVTWDGINDPKSPRNWKNRRKWKIAILASLQTLVSTVCSSMMAPAVPNILADYHNSNRTVGSLMVSIMILVWSFTAILWAPLAEVIGRKRVLVISAFGDLVFNVACSVSPTSATMLVFRALAGAFNSAPIAMSAGSLADVFDDDHRQWPLAVWSLAPSCGPGISPVIAGYIAEYTTWRWVFYSIVIMQGIMCVALVLWFEETYPPILLRRKCKKLIKETGNTCLHTIWDLVEEPAMEKVRIALIRPVLFLFLNPVVLLLSTYLAFVYGFMYLILTDFSALWLDKYHYSVGTAGLMYLGYPIGMLLGVFFWTSMINWWCKRMEARGKGSLEQRLFWLPISTVSLAGGMLWYGWSAQAKLPWPMPIVGIAIFAFSVFCVFQSVQSYVVSLNATLAGSAISACVLGRCILGGTFPLFGHAMYQKLGYGWASTVVALLAIVLGIPWPIGIYIYGPRLRAWADANIKIA